MEPGPDYVIAKTYADRFAAERDQQMLETSGVKSVVAGDDASGWAPFLSLPSGGVALLVEKADEDKAKGILTESEPT